VPGRYKSIPFVILLIPFKFGFFVNSVSISVLSIACWHRFVMSTGCKLTSLSFVSPCVVVNVTSYGSRSFLIFSCACLRFAHAVASSEVEFVATVLVAAI